jgi:integrase
MCRWQQENLPHKTWPQHDFVLCNEKGERANTNTFEHWWRSWADGNGWPGLRFHDLRHSHATILIANGVDVKTAQMRLGHSSAEVTLSIYAHAIPLADSAAAASLDAELFK